MRTQDLQFDGYQQWNDNANPEAQVNYFIPVALGNGIPEADAVPAIISDHIINSDLDAIVFHNIQLRPFLCYKYDKPH